MKEPITLELTGRETLALLNAAIAARMDLKDRRPEMISAEDKIAKAIQDACIESQDAPGSTQAVNAMCGCGDICER